MGDLALQLLKNSGTVPLRKRTEKKEPTKKKKKKEKEKSEVVHTKWKNATVMHKKRGWDNKTHAREITN